MNQNKYDANFSNSIFIQKDSLKHTFKLKESNSYEYIPIFQKNEKINFGNQFYKIIRLQRRTENFLQYRIQELDKQQLITIEYQFKFDEKLNDENYIYYEDQTKIFNKESQNYRNSCRIAIKKTKNRHLKLTRFIHLNYLNQNAKIKLLHNFANNEQLEQLDYNQIYIDDKQQIKISKIQQNQNSCFIQAPISISPILHFQQTFLIGFYYSIINSLVFFNHYINRENNIKQALQNGFNSSTSQLQQQIKGTINYQYKLQIPKGFVQQGINRIFDQQQQAEYVFLCVLIDIIWTILKIQELAKNLQQSIVQLQKLNNQLEEIIINTEDQQNQTNSSLSIDEQSSDKNNHVNLLEGFSRIFCHEQQIQDLQLIYCDSLNYFNQIQNTLKKTVQASVQNYSQSHFDEINLLKNRIEAQFNDLVKKIEEQAKQIKHLKNVDQTSTYFLLNLYNSFMMRKEHSEPLIELTQKTNFLENRINRSQKEEKFMKFKSLSEEIQTRIKALTQFFDSQKQDQSIFDCYIFAAYIKDDFVAQILNKLKQLFKIVKDFTEINLETNTHIDNSSPRKLKSEILSNNLNKISQSIKKLIQVSTPKLNYHNFLIHGVDSGTIKLEDLIIELLKYIKPVAENYYTPIFYFKSKLLISSILQEIQQNLSEILQKTNFLENISNRTQKEETLLKDKVQTSVEFKGGILFYESKKQNQGIFVGCRFAAYINEDPHIQILIELQQLFQMVEDLMLENNTHFDISSLRQLKQEIVDQIKNINEKQQICHHDKENLNQKGNKRKLKKNKVQSQPKRKNFQKDIQQNGSQR